MRSTRMARWLLLLLATVLSGLALTGLSLSGFALSGLARADIDGQIFKSEDWRVSLESPKGWQLSDHSSYPSILLWMTHRRPAARMLFAAEKLEPGQDSQSYAAATAAKLEKLGFRLRAPQLHSATGAYWMDFDNGKSFLRQALLVPADSKIGYSLTLSAGDLRTRGQMLRAFDFSLRSIKPKR